MFGNFDKSGQEKRWNNKDFYKEIPGKIKTEEVQHLSEDKNVGVQMEEKYVLLFPQITEAK